MKQQSIFKLFGLAIIILSLWVGCEHNSFGEDLEDYVSPTDLVYADIVNAREFSYIETAPPTLNSNGKPVMFEIVHIKKDDQILDDSYMNSVEIVNYSELETDVTINTTGDEVKIYTDDLSEAGKIIIKDGNPFAAGDYYFTVKASAGGMLENIFEDVFHLNIGPGLATAISYCPFQMNFVSGESAVSNPVEMFGGNTDVRYELATESDKLSIDAVTGAISLNTSYAVTQTETLNPIINVISNISDEVVSFENTFTAVISTTSVALDKGIDYFFYPTLKPSNKDIPRAGGNGYSVQTDDFVDKPGWVQKHFYKEIVPAQRLNFPEVLDTRTEAGVSGVTGLQFNYWGPLKNPFEAWMVADAVNLTQYSGCFDSKVVFWIRQELVQSTLDQFPGHTETPVRVEVKISDNYSGDVSTASWEDVNELMTCKIGENGSEFTGTPYPISGEIGAEGDANNTWVKCELDLSNYSDKSAFTIAFRTKTNYDTDLSDNLRGILYISDLHFVATEK